MGCTGSSLAKGDESIKKIRKPKPWKHSEPITRAQLTKMREEFWDTAPHYGGRKALDAKILRNSTGLHSLLNRRIFTKYMEKISDDKKCAISEIWDALRAAAEADVTLAQAIVDSAGVIVQTPDLTICYDERGAKYELPKYVMSEPTNLIRDS